MIRCFTIDIYVYEAVCGNFVIYDEGSMVMVRKVEIDKVVG